MNSRKNDPRAVTMFISAMVIFGTIGIFRVAIPFSSPFVAFTRGILGGACLLAYMKATGRGTREKWPARTKAWLMISGAVMGFNWILLFEAYRYTSVGIATLCYYMQPTIVMLLSPMLFREKLTGKKAACAAIAIVGMVLISGVTGTEETPGGHFTGILLGLGAAVLYATVVIMNKKAPGLDAYRKTTIQLLSAGAVMVPYLAVNGSVTTGEVTPGGIMLLVIVGIVHTGIAYVLYFGSMDGLKAQSAAIFSYIDPVAAVLFSAVFLGESLSVYGMIGAALIIGSAILSEM